MANYTEHYGLHQWVPEDDFLRTDFNTDFALIDAALAGLAAADGAESAARSQEDGELAAAITAGDNAQAAAITAGDNAQASALASAKTALQNAITSGDNAQASALAAAKTALQNAITAESQTRSQTDATLSANKLELVCGSFVGTAPDESMTAQTINLGFQPRLVLFGVTEDFTYAGTEGFNCNCLVLYPGVVCSGGTGWDYGSGQITSNGFQAAGRSNYGGKTYRYAAVR